VGQDPGRTLVDPAEPLIREADRLRVHLGPVVELHPPAELEGEGPAVLGHVQDSARDGTKLRVSRSV